MIRPVSLCSLLLLACGGGQATPDAMVDARLEGFDKPDLVCPGGPSCANAGDGVLKVGAAKRTFTPQDFETYTDENMDRKWQTTEPYTDKNGNGKFDGVWLFGGERAAEGVKTDVEARAIAFVQGDTTVVIVYNDCIGLLAGDMEIIRNDPRLASLGIDHVMIGSTHAHDAPDTVGLWGPQVAVTGRQPFVVKALYEADVAAITEAVQNAQPAQLVIASTPLINDPATRTSKTDDWAQDIRDPVIFDPTLTIARFVKVSDPTTTIGTIVNWADHPEVAHFDDTVPAMITAHYPHWLRDHVENGVLTTASKYALQNLAGLGGVTVFVQGALGGQIGSIRGTHPPGPNGTPITMESSAMDQAIGTNAAARALTALRDSGESTSVLPLSVKTAKFWAKIENTYFHVAFLVNLLGPHELAGYNKDQSIDETNEPWISLRSTYIQIGPLGIVSAPGELHPELWVGGYDGSWSWGWPLLMHAGKCADTHNDCSGPVDCNAGIACTPSPNQPNFMEAPQPPYMRDLVLAHPGVRYPVLAGLAEDYVGYIVPAYNYALDPNNPYITEAQGDHYEEVYSLGPLVEQHAVHPILQLLQYRAP
ncbi:MAG: hypothetical protein JWO36_6386 [Myxococcales bacterium]|nr:hypothetical protein [Myxococcales bacterium]